MAINKKNLDKLNKLINELNNPKKFNLDKSNGLDNLDKAIELINVLIDRCEEGFKLVSEKIELQKRVANLEKENSDEYIDSEKMKKAAFEEDIRNLNELIKQLSDIMKDKYPKVKPSKIFGCLYEIYDNLISKVLSDQNRDLIKSILLSTDLAKISGKLLGELPHLYHVATTQEKIKLALAAVAISAAIAITVTAAIYAAPVIGVGLAPALILGGLSGVAIGCLWLTKISSALLNNVFESINNRSQNSEKLNSKISELDETRKEFVQTFEELGIKFAETIKKEEQTTKNKGVYTEVMAELVSFANFSANSKVTNVVDINPEDVDHNNKTSIEDDYIKPSSISKFKNAG